MGIFDIFGRRKKEAEQESTAGNDNELVTITIEGTREELRGVLNAISILGNFDEQRAEEDEQQVLAELEEQQARRKAALEDRGVRTYLLTMDKCRADLFDMADVLCGIDLSTLGPCEREAINWKPLTSTGKVPKCVATFDTHWSFWNEYSSAGAVTCEVSYLADGTPYTAWINDLRGSGTFYKIKTVNGKLALIAENPA